MASFHFIIFLAFCLPQLTKDSHAEKEARQAAEGLSTSAQRIAMAAKQRAFDALSSEIDHGITAKRAAAAADATAAALASVQAELAAVRVQLDRACAEREDACGQLSTVRDRAATLASRVPTLETEAAQARHAAADAEDRAAVLDNERLELQNMLSEQSFTVATLTQEVEDARQAGVEGKRYLEEEVAELTQQLNIAAAELRALGERRGSRDRRQEEQWHG